MEKAGHARLFRFPLLPREDQRWRTSPPPLGAGATGGGGAAGGAPIGAPGGAMPGATFDGAEGTAGACRVTGAGTGAGAKPGTTIPCCGAGVTGCGRVTGRVTLGAAGTTLVGGGTAPT